MTTIPALGRQVLIRGLAHRHSAESMASAVAFLHQD